MFNNIMECTRVNLENNRQIIFNIYWDDEETI